MSHPMDEPFDEIMGRIPPRKSVQTSSDAYAGTSSTVTPDPSPTYGNTRTATTSRGAPPPSNAFGHNTRWAQYEQDDSRLKRESDQAYATAVAAAAEHAAHRQASYSDSAGPDDEFASPKTQFRDRYYDDPERQVQDRLARGGASLPPPEPSTSTKRTESSAASPTEILRSLSRMSRGGEEERVDFSQDPHVKVRAEAMKVLEMADGHDDVASTASSTRRRTPKALAGLDFTKSGGSSRNKPYRDDPRFSVDDDDHEDLVDVVEAERNSKNRAFDMDGGGDDDSDSKNKSSWSSRYSNPLNSHLSTLTGGNRTSNSILDAYDRQHARQARTGRDSSFSSSPSSPPSSPGIFGSGFSFRQKHVFGSQSPQSPSQYNIQNHRTVWSDGGSSLPPPTPARSWQSTIERKQKRRRRLTILFILLALVGIVCGVVFGLKNRNSGGSGGSFSMTGDGVGQVITFFVTANVPLNADDAMKLEGDLAVVPGNVHFIAHLGNIQDSAVTLCNEAAYEDVSVVLMESTVPVFMVPGADDWNNCPDRTEAWRNWLDNFEEFESAFPNNLSTDRQLGRRENFSFVHQGVLFLGLHLLAGPIPDQEEWDLRHEQNLQWVEEKLSEDTDSFRAVVIFGNARPSQQQHSFFEEAVREIKKVGKPTLYVHANGGGGLEEYTPFDKVKNLWAVQAEDGGSSPPVKITVGYGSKPFEVGLPSLTEEEEAN